MRRLEDFPEWIAAKKAPLDTLESRENILGGQPDSFAPASFQ
jgi:hypothetical protein